MAMGEAAYSPNREPMRFIGARVIKRDSRHISDRWLGPRATPACLATAAVLLLAAGAFLGQLSAHKAAAAQPVKYIHVITPNASCDGIGAAAAAAQTDTLQQFNTDSTTGSTAAVPGNDTAAALLSSILPLTNFSALTSGQILDAAASGNVSVQQLQPLMQLHQHLWCSAGYNTVPVPNITTVKFSNVSISLYAGNDIVSNQLRGKGRSWEHNEIKEMLWAVRQYWKQDAVMRHLGSRPQQAAAAVAVAGAATSGSGRLLLQQQHHQQEKQQPQDDEKQGFGGSRQLLSAHKASSPLMVDVGSNVGWFAINAAAAGARVAAFEAMDSNLALLRRSLCANQWLAQRIALFGTGLGTEPGACSIVSGEDNRGDGIVLCGQDPQAAMKQRGWNTTLYKVRGAITIKRLDTLIQEDIQVMKMDVEGFELHVLRGATDLLQRFNVWYIMLECNEDLLGGQKGQFEYFKYLDEAGYSISTYGFSGPFINPEYIKDGSLRISAWNLYCVRKDLRQAQIAAQAGVTPPKGKKP